MCMQCACNVHAVCCSVLQCVASEKNRIQIVLFELPSHGPCAHVCMQCSCSVDAVCCSALRCVAAREMGFKSLLFSSPIMEPVRVCVCSAHAVWMQCVAVCHSELQCVASCCSVLQCTPVRKLGFILSAPPTTEHVHMSLHVNYFLKYFLVEERITCLQLQYDEALQHTATPATHCNTLQHTASHCNTLSYMFVASV